MIGLNKLCVLLLLLICVKFSRNASLSIYEQRKYKNLIEGQGLFSADDDVEVLTKANFKNRVYGQTNAWIVEFYNTWCGFCQRFAPSWKALATDIKQWQGVINVAALDCSDDENSPLCRDFEIMAYPTLRYFHENFIEGSKNIGVDVAKGSDMEEHKNNLVNHMIKEQENKKGLTFPNLLPYQYPNLVHLFLDGANVKSKYMFLIIDLPMGTLGPQLALDFHNYNQIGIRYATTENTELVQSVHAKNFPFMMVISDHNESHIFAEGLVTREALRSAVIEYVKPTITIKFDDNKPEIFTGKWVEVPVPDITSLLEAKARKALRDKVKKMGDVVFQADLESALRYSLKQEVGTVNDISGEKLKALHDYLNVLVKYFPFGPNGHVFLQETLELVKRKTLLAGTEISAIVEKYDDDSKRVFSSAHQWIACEGSSPHLRGYPCGLWKLFHYLTVQSSERNSPPKEVLHAMYGYIRNFFGCAECSKHFQEMAHRKDLEGISSTNSAVLWLWMAHNDVNKRLSGDVTEDAEFPKIQFPSAESCPKCRGSENSWEYNEVLEYIKNMYNSVNIRYIGADSTVLHPGLNSQRNGSSTVFEQIDASMCFILYLLSFLLILILIRIFLKKGYRKKMYTHDLLGKV